jgi:Tol biopolymer transport system component
MRDQKARMIGWMILWLATPALTADVKGPYFGQTPPGKTPQLFAPGILTLPGGVVTVTRIAFSPDGNECFFSGPVDWNYSSTRMYYTQCIDNVWTPHVLASFFPGYSCRQPYFSADGNTLYFSSNRNGTSDIWMASRKSQGWGNPQVLPSPINTSSYDGMYTQTTDGTVYVESDRAGGQGGFDVWRISPPRPGQPQQAQNLGAPVNTGGDNNDPFVSPDGRYLVFGSNYDDLFVASDNGHGGWTAPVNLNQYCPGINTGNQEYAPFISADGRYLFFSRTSGGGIFWVANPIPSPDPNGRVYNLSTGDRFGTVQAAVSMAQAGQVILLSPGTYRENLTLPNRVLTIRSANAQDSAVVSLTSLVGDGDSPVVSLAAGTALRSIQGLTITGGTDGVVCEGAMLQVSSCVITGHQDCGIEVSEESTLSMDHCIVAGNAGPGLRSMPKASARRGPTYSKVDLTQCTLVQNRGCGLEGDGITAANSILYGNGISVGDLQIKGYNTRVSYSDVQGRFVGEGNLDADPAFVASGQWTDPNTYIQGDYHLKSQAGHWNPRTYTWVLDDATSPCIDTGDPNTAFGLEPSPNGSRVNLGVYGNTTEASRSPLKEVD